MNTLVIKTENDLKTFLFKNYMTQIENFFGDNKSALKFLSGVMASVQRTPKLLECDPMSVVNSFLTMAQLGLMPSDVSGEAYVLPYNGKSGSTAQFQLGYQGLITLFYRAGGQSVRSEIIREHDVFSYKNGQIEHTVDIMKTKDARGKAIGAYAIAVVDGEEIALAMNGEDIRAHGQKFSKSYGTKFTPWNEQNDPELWMWKKTVLKQLGKLLPKNETINRAIAEDNKDSVVQERLEAARNESQSLKIGNFVSHEEKNHEDKQGQSDQDVADGAESGAATN